MLEKLVARQVALLDALVGQFLHHLGLRGYRGMVGTGYPEGILAFHAGSAHQDVLNGVVEHVAHVEHTRHVGRRDDDAVRLAAVGFRTKELVV